MNTENEHLDTLRDIKKMMERSSRFISLSGLSGIAAGCCALVGAFFAYRQIHNASYYNTIRAMDIADSNISDTMATLFKHPLFITAIITLIAAICSAALFTWLRTKKSNIPILGTAGKRLMINVAVPLAVGGLFILKLIELHVYGLISPACLLFYGLALVNASKYTLGEIRYLGYAQLVLGVINLWVVGYGLYFWTLGFGVLHIVYGIIMWLKYEK